MLMYQFRLLTQNEAIVLSNILHYNCMGCKLKVNCSGPAASSSRASVGQGKVRRSSSMPSRRWCCIQKCGPIPAAAAAPAKAGKPSVRVPQMDSLAAASRRKGTSRAGPWGNGGCCCGDGGRAAAGRASQAVRPVRLGAAGRGACQGPVPCQSPSHSQWHTTSFNTKG